MITYDETDIELRESDFNPPADYRMIHSGVECMYRSEYDEFLEDYYSTVQEYN